MPIFLALMLNEVGNKIFKRRFDLSKNSYVFLVVCANSSVNIENDIYFFMVLFY
jgi:hypothetical protein